MDIDAIKSIIDTAFRIDGSVAVSIINDYESIAASFERGQSRDLLEAAAQIRALTNKYK